MSDTITESRLAWVRFHLYRWLWPDDRATTPLEYTQQAEIASLKSEIKTLEETLSEVRFEVVRLKEAHAITIEKLNTQIEMKTEEIDLSAEMHARIVLKIQAESAAYAAQIPPEAKT